MMPSHFLAFSFMYFHVVASVSVLTLREERENKGEEVEDAEPVVKFEVKLLFPQMKTIFPYSFPRVPTLCLLLKAAAPTL